ncbi:MAG: cupin domain-containing protein [Xanthomonadales bacterium]|nr:cupin domain-containing protein [Xanthomonadales bacterium]
MSPASFLRRFWQRRPLLVRGAFAELAGTLPDRELLALAARRDALVRLVRRERGRFRLEHGPFPRRALAALPGRDWTVLVQDVEKWLPERFAPLLRGFAFLPSWRIDDVMVSLAAPGGSVGPHIDRYDAFLIQGSGRREWRLDLRAGGWRPWPGSELRLVRGFRATWRALLEPGDALYLPPGIPHHGIALERAQTWSLGLRAPALGELLGALADQLLEDEAPELLADPDLEARRRAGELTPKDLRRFARALATALADRERLAVAIARFLSTWRSEARLSPRRSRPDPGRLLRAGGRLRRRPWSRAVWWRSGEQVRLALAGELFAATARLAGRIAGGGWIDARALPDPVPEELELLRRLAALGALELAMPSDPVR